MSHPAQKPDPLAPEVPSRGPSTADFRAAEPSSSDLLTQAPVAGASGSASPVPAPPGYEILSLLGHGGQSLVYKARHAPTDRVVALKVLRDGMLALPEHQARLRREAQAIEKLQHPHIVQIYEVGSHLGQPFLALEFIEDGSLEARRHEWPLPPHIAARLVQTLAETMHFVHEQGIIHRDLKPANILLVAKSSDLLPKITDFGLAKKEEDSQSLTNTGAVMGTTGYMAPEQAEGRTKQATPATDIYALGAILYDLLAGKPPFDGSLLEVLEKVKNHSPPPLPLGVPYRLAQICMKCLEKSPQRRYPTAGELAAELGRFLSPAVPASNIVGATKSGLLRNLLHHSAQVSSVCFCATGDRLWSADLETSDVLLWHLETGTVERRLTGHVSGIETFACSPDDHWMMTCTLHGSLRLIDLRETNTVYRFDQLTKPTSCVAFSPCSTWALTGDQEGHLRLWDIPTHLTLLRVRGHAGAVHTVAFSPDGATMASGGEDQKVRLYHTQSGSRIYPPGSSYHSPRKYPIRRVRFSPDGRLLAFCDTSDVINVWESSTGQVKHQLHGHRLMVGDIAFSPDGRCLLSVGHEGTLRIWDLESGRECHSFSHEQDRFGCLAISRDGRYAATGTLDGPIRIWQLPDLNG